MRGSGHRQLMAVLLTGMAFSSCTCHQEPPPAGPENRIARKSDGFGAALPTARQPDAEERVALERPTPAHRPTLPTAPPEVPTPGEIAMPEDFPEDVPVFENAEAFHVQQLPQNAHSVLFRADAERKAIFDFYAHKMPSQGWNKEQEYEAREQSFLSFKKGKMITNMTITKDPRTGKQIIGIMYYEEQDLPFPEF